MIRDWKLVIVASALSIGSVELSQSAYGDDLKRRGMVGVQLAPVNDEVKQRLNLSSTKGVVLNGIVPDSAAQKAGLLANDVVLKIGSDEIDGVPTFIKTLRKYGGGDKLSFTVLRAGQEVTADVVLLPRPMETATEYDVVYDSAGESGQRVRTVLTKPKDAGKHAAVLFMHGLAPNTIEFGTPRPNPYKSISA